MEETGNKQILELSFRLSGVSFFEEVLGSERRTKQSLNIFIKGNKHKTKKAFNYKYLSEIYILVVAYIQKRIESFPLSHISWLYLWEEVIYRNNHIVKLSFSLWLWYEDTLGFYFWSVGSLAWLGCDYCIVLHSVFC